MTARPQKGTKITITKSGRRAAVRRTAKPEHLKHTPKFCWLATPAAREAQRRGGQSKKKGNRRGIPDGYTKATIMPIRRRAQRKAKLIMSELKKNDLITVDDERAEACLEAAIEIVVTKDDKNNNKHCYCPRDRIAAIKTVLEYTKKKPAQTQHLEVKNAEDFLDELAERAKNSDD